MRRLLEVLTLRERNARLALAACCLAGCTCSPDRNPGTTFDGGPPEAVCDAPALYDVSSPTTVVGDGTPASCTAEALQSAADAGGTIVFDCGASPVTITVGSPIVFTEETVLD